MKSMLTEKIKSGCSIKPKQRNHFEIRIIKREKPRFQPAVAVTGNAGCVSDWKMNPEP
jgi:hypothetical protein